MEPKLMQVCARNLNGNINLQSQMQDLCTNPNQISIHGYQANVGFVQETSLGISICNPRCRICAQNQIKCLFMAPKKMQVFLQETSLGISTCNPRCRIFAQNLSGISTYKRFSGSKYPCLDVSFLSRFLLKINDLTSVISENTTTKPHGIIRSILFLKSFITLCST